MTAVPETTVGYRLEECVDYPRISAVNAAVWRSALRTSHVPTRTGSSTTTMSYPDGDENGCRLGARRA